jgi:hypothetical protein
LEDADLAHLICLAKVASGYTLAKAEVMESELEWCDCHNEVTQSLPIRQLPKQENQQMVPTSKTLDIFIAVILCDEPLEILSWKKIHKLAENVSTLVHLTIYMLLAYIM